MLLNPQFLPQSPRLGPLLPNVVMSEGNLLLLDSQLTHNPSAPLIYGKPNQTLLSMGLTAAHQEPAIIAIMIDGSPVSPVSSQESVSNGPAYASSDYRPVRSPAPSPYGDYECLDLRMVHVPSKFQIAVLQDRSEPDLSPSMTPEERLSQDFVEYGENGESNDLKEFFSKLEMELMNDDEDESFASQPTGIPEKGWMDLLQDILPDCSAFRTTCNCDQLRSEANSEAQVRTSAAQSSPASADIDDHVKNLLISCATAIAEDDFDLARNLVDKLNQLSSVEGEPMQRLAAYMTVGLGALIEQSVDRLCEDFSARKPLTEEILSALRVLFRFCPYLRFGFLAANGAIAEAFQDEDKVHIIDFEIRQGNQWVALIKAFGTRPTGPPQLRITSVEDPAWPSFSLQSVGTRLVEIAKSAGVPFEFHAVQMNVSQWQQEKLGTRAGEALAVNFAYHLSHLPDESVCPTNPRDSLLRRVRELKPKVVTVVEQEANANTSPFLPRFREVLDYFAALFESLDLSFFPGIQDLLHMEAQSVARVIVDIQQHILARVVVNMIAYEGTERVDRYEKHGKWRFRMTMAGFQPFRLNPHINNTIKDLLRKYPSNYRLKEEDGALFLGWLEKDLIVASAWH